MLALMRYEPDWLTSTSRKLMIITKLVAIFLENEPMHKNKPTNLFHVKLTRNYALLWAVFLLFITGCSGILDTIINYNLENVDLPCNEWETFTSSLGNFSISYPRGWIAIDLPYGNHGDDEAVTLLNSSTSILPTVIIARKSSAMTFDEVVVWGEERMTNKFKRDFELNDVDKIDNQNYEGATRTYKGGLKTKEPLFGVDFYIARKQDSIIISLSATQSQYDEAKKCFDVMVNSFNPIH